MPDFALHPQLDADTLEIVDLPLCRVLLMNDSQYPWLILVPRVADIRDIDELTAADSAQLNDEIRLACGALRACVTLDKINVASLGNMVPQLHIHVIARRTSDAAWPRPVWGVASPIPYKDSALLDSLQTFLK